MAQWSDLQGRVRAIIDRLVATGSEAGVQVAAYLDGTPIVDEVAGVADARDNRPMTADTPVFCFSAGKGLTATVVHVLAERGALDYDLRIADVWLEYAQHGKGDTTLRHALTHSAGVPQLPADITPEDFADWDKMCAIVAGAEPVWAPGTAEGYHAWTFSWLVGETVRRATGATLSDVLADEIAKPLGVPHELFLKVPDDQLDRLAHLDDRNWAAAAAMLGGLLPNLDRVAPSKVRPDAELGNRRDLLSAEVAAVGTMSARAVARMYAAVLGEVDGVRLFGAERLNEAITPEPKSKDWVFAQEVTRGLGYSVEGERFGMGGMGGSLAYAFPQLGLTVAATKNRLAVGSEGDDPMEDLCALIRDAVTARGAS